MILSHTIEEFGLPENEYRLVTPDGIVDTIEVELTVDYQPPERKTWDYPGAPAIADIVAVKVSEVTTCDEDGTELHKITGRLFCEIVAQWLFMYWAEGQEDWALEKAGELERDQYEAAMEARAEARRELLSWEGESNEDS